MELNYRVYAENEEFPAGKMYYPGTMAELHGNRGFVLNQFGDLIHATNLGEHGSQYSQVWARIGYNNVVVMLKTDLTDKNGKELYFGDCYEISLNGSRNPVVWTLRNFKDLTDLHNFIANDWEFEIIGNIHEDPLLNRTDDIHAMDSIFYLHIDRDNKRLHILDADKPGTRSVTNNISTEFIENALIGTLYMIPTPAERDEYLNHLNTTYTILLYGTDGIISSWSEKGGFDHVPLEDPMIHGDFYDVMIKRRYA